MANKPAPKGRVGLVALVGTAAAGLLAFVAQSEGKVNDPHWDRFAKIYDVCYGETTVPMRHYSDAECDEMLATRLTEFAGAVLKRNPELRGHDPQVVATGSLTYNIGAVAYSRSTVAKRFSEGRWRSACNAFLAWNRAGGQVVRGLTIRRERERAICLRDIPAEFDR